MIVLPATVTLREATATLRSLAASLEAEPAGADGAVVVDASALQRFDSSAIAVLIECRRLTESRGGRRLRLQGAPAPLLGLAKLYGVQDLLPAQDAAGT